MVYSLRSSGVVVGRRRRRDGARGRTDRLFSALLAASCTIVPRSNITTRSASPRIFCAFCSTMIEQMPPAAGDGADRLQQFLDDDGRQPLGRLVQQQHLRVRGSARGRSPASAARRRRAGCRNCCAAPSAAETSRRPSRPSTARAAPPRSCSLRPSASGRCCAPAAPSRCRRGPAGPAAARVMSLPASATLPPKRRVMPTIELISVVLPVPLRPSSASTWPSASAQRHVGQHHRLAVAGAQGLDGEQIRHRRSSPR